VKDLRDQLLKHLNSDLDWRGPRSEAAARERWDKGPKPAPPEKYKEAVAAFRVRLVELVEEWIGSGRDGEFEYPRLRTLRPGAKGAHADLLEWDRSNRPHIFRAATGEQRILAGRHTSTWPAEPKDLPIKRMCREATGMFGALMDDLRLKRQISKCCECGKYYFRGKPLPRYPLKSACVPCGKRLPQDAKRKKQHGVLIAKAALSLRQWKGLSEPERESYLSIQDYIAFGLKQHRVGVKWVDSYWKEIKQYKPERGIAG
jgi:hypothetical protein